MVRTLLSLSLVFFGLNANAVLLDSCAAHTIEQAPLQKSVREYLEDALQQYRYATTDLQESEAKAAMYYWLEKVVMPFYSKKFFEDRHFCEDAFQEAYLVMVADLNRQRIQNAPPRKYVGWAYTNAKRTIIKLRRKNRKIRLVDMSELADTRSPQSLRSLGPQEGQVRIVTSLASFENYFHKPFSLSARQLAVLRGLSEGTKHKAIANELGMDLRAVHDTVGNIETKFQKFFRDDSIRRSELSFLAEEGSENLIHINFSRGNIKRNLLAEGPIPFEPREMEVLISWIRNKKMRQSKNNQRLLAKLMTERRRDFRQVFDGPEESFAHIYDIYLTEFEGEYALLRAFGVEKHDIAQFNPSRNETRVEKIRQKMEDVSAPDGVRLDYLRPYYCMLGENRRELRAVVPDLDGRWYLLRIHIGQERTHRYFRQRIQVKEGAVREAIAQMEGRIQEVMELWIFENMSKPEIMEHLGLGKDWVQVSLARGSRQLSVALGEPRLSLRNIEVVPDDE